MMDDTYGDYANNPHESVNGSHDGQIYNEISEHIGQPLQSPGEVEPPFKKKKITRLRPLRSCIACNKRKIKCDRQDGGCSQCSKRGEADKCSLVAAKESDDSPSMVLERLRVLESRIEELEAAQATHSTPSSQANNDTDAFNANTKGAIQPKTESADNSNNNILGIPDATEAAALVLESLCNTQRAKPPVESPKLSSLGADTRSYKSTILLEEDSERDAFAVQRSSRIRSRILRATTFPSKALSDFLIDIFFRFLDGYWHVHINYLFEDEYAHFWRLRERGEDHLVDPAWLALYLQTLALGVQVAELPLPVHLSGTQTALTEDLVRAQGWVDDVEELLKAANWLRKPQIRTLQTIILLNGYQTMSTLKDPAGAPWNAAAIRLAQLMGLHELSSDSTRMLEDDPAVPKGHNQIKIQVGRRLWMSLVVLEHVYAVRMGLTLPLASTPFTTVVPLNIDDIDLAKEPLQEKPVWRLTNISSLLVRWVLAETFRGLMLLPANMSASEKHGHVMNVDMELRKWLAGAPANPMSGDASDYGSYKLQVWRQWAFLADIHGQLLHIHRPYMVRGYSDSRYALSTKICLESAKVICDSRLHLQDSIVDERFWWTSMRWLSAAIVLFIDLYQAIDGGCSDEVLEIKKAEIPGIQSILQARTKSCYPPVRNFAFAAMRVIENLVEAEKAKRISARSRRNSITATSEEKAEPVGSVFQRIAKSIASYDALADKRMSLPRSQSDRSTKTSSSRLATGQHSSTPNGPDGGSRPTRTISVTLPLLHHPQPTTNGTHYYNEYQSPYGPSEPHQATPPMLSAHAMVSGDSGEGSVYSALHPLALDTPAAPSSHFQTPISWDTSHFFHPDPSVLLESMGYTYAAPGQSSNGMYSTSQDGTWYPTNQ